MTYFGIISMLGDLLLLFKNMANKNAHRQDYGQKLTLYIEIYILL